MESRKEIRPALCLKDRYQTVTYQDETCKDLCGDQVGRKCDKGCMKSFAEIDKDELFKIGFHHFKNIEIDGKKIDAVVCFDGDTIVTNLFSLQNLTEKRMAMLKEKGLSKAELNVIRFVLEGLSNQQIVAKLFISKATLKTHLNNIYKKVPQFLRPDRS